eukprot:333112_1
MQTIHTSKELALLRDTIKLHPAGERNKDIAFLSLMLYKMVLSITKQQYIKLVEYIISKHNASIIFDNIQLLIVNNKQQFVMKSNSNIKSEISIEHENMHISSFQNKYWHKLASFVAAFVGFSKIKNAEWNLIKLLVNYIDQVTVSMKKVPENMVMETPIDVLIYLYTHKTTDYFYKKMQDENDQKQCNKTRQLNMTTPADGQLFIRAILEQFYEDYTAINKAKMFYYRQTSHTICVSLFEYFVRSSIHKYRAKKWNFCFHFIKFLGEYNVRYSDVMRKGLGFVLFKDICKRYKLKQGPYTKVKKILNQWTSDKFYASMHGWWHWYNKTLNECISFPMELKSYFKLFNKAYDNGQTDVYAMECHFKIVRRVHDLKLLNNCDAIPIFMDRRDIIDSILNTHLSYNNQIHLTRSFSNSTLNSVDERADTLQDHVKVQLEEINDVVSNNNMGEDNDCLLIHKHITNINVISKLVIRQVSYVQSKQQLLMLYSATNSFDGQNSVGLMK